MAPAPLCRRAVYEVPKKDEGLKPLRTALTDLILAGLSEREIAAAVQRELAALRRKGGPV